MVSMVEWPNCTTMGNCHSVSNLKSKIKDRESELKRMKQQAQEAKKSVEHDIVPLEKLLSRLVPVIAGT